MKRIFLFLSIFIVSIFISAYMQSFINLRDYYYIIDPPNDKDKNKNKDLDEIFMAFADIGMNPKAITSNSVSLIKPIRLYQGDFFLKAVITLDYKVNIKITNTTNGAPVYYRQFVPSTTEELLISTSAWQSGDYKIEFTNEAGIPIATGDFSIR